MLINQNKCLGLIIDIQEKLYTHISEHERLLEQTIKLIKGIQVLEIPLIVTQQYTRGLGPTIAELQKYLTDVEPIEKRSFSCCGETVFNSALQGKDKAYILMAGIEAHVCVQQTALELKAKGYLPVIIADCVNSRNPYDKEIAIQRMQDAGCIITTCESILFELCRVSGTAEFKEISKIIK